jgi:hypothetical protein
MAIILEKDKIKKGQIVQYPSKFIATNSFNRLFFDTEEGYVIGSPSAPLSANTITLDLTNAFIGSTSEIFHNGSILPTYSPFSGSIDIRSEFGKYEPTLLNIITIKYLGGTDIKITYNRNITQEDVTGDKHYVHVQGPPQNIWTVTHNLNKKPSLTVIDSSGNMVVGKLTYVNLNILTIQFASPISGEAICN